MKQYQLRDHGAVERWERIYLDEGPEELFLERRVRRNGSRPKKVSPEIEEDLIAQVQRLQA